MKKAFLVIFALIFLLSPSVSLAQSEFNPHYIISDDEMQNFTAMTRDAIQLFLNDKGSYLKNLLTEDANGLVKTAADIIYEAAVNNRINPKFLLVTLQKEQSLVTDDSPSTRQLDWAAGFAVCDGCSLSDPKVAKYKGFGKQIDGAAGIIRWYYDNKESQPFIKKKDAPTMIDDEEVVPQSWATAFLYTYTPHLHGNKNFWKIWQTWFSQLYPNGTLIQSASSSEYWLIQNGQKRKFATKTALASRIDPKLAVIVSESDLNNYPEGTAISFANYSLLKTPSRTYLLDHETLRPFASDEVVRQLGYNPQEITEVNDSDLAGYEIGPEITTETTNPKGVIYQITDLKNALYLFKNNTLYSLIDPAVAAANYSDLPVEKKKLKDISALPMSDEVIKFRDGTLLKENDGGKLYVVENGKKRRISDNDTFIAMGYKPENLVPVSLVSALSIPAGDPIYVDNGLASAKNKFLGDLDLPVEDLAKTKVPTYLVAEYPSGKIIAGKNIDQRRPIASLTKIMTAYEALDQNIDLTKATAYSKKKHEAYNNPLNLRDGEKIKNLDLLNASLIASINIASRMLAQTVAPSEKEFIADIQTRLDDWGADDTKIADVTGLSEKDVSTARNLLKIFVKALDKKTLRDALSKVDYSFKETLDKNGVAKHYLKNTNQLMFNSQKGYRILASKTGYTDEAQSTLMMLVESKKTKSQYVIITLGDSDYAHRFNESNKIAEWISTGKVNIAGK